MASGVPESVWHPIRNPMRKGAGAGQRLPPSEAPMLLHPDPSLVYFQRVPRRVGAWHLAEEGPRVCAMYGI